MKIPTSKLLLLAVPTLLAIACSSPNSLEKETKPEEAIHLDTIPSVTLPEVEVDPFLSKIDSISPLFVNWKFEEPEEIVLNDSTQYDRHWWLKKFKNNPAPRPGIPLEQDYLTLKSIRQFHFVRGWRYVIEEWELESEEAAERWHSIASRASTSPTYTLEKPPNVFWREGNKLYFIMATAANMWFAHGDSVIEQFTERTKGDLRSEMRKGID